MTSLILLSVLWALLLPLPATAGLIEGLRKYEAGDYDGAIGEWQPLADQGNPDALFNLGQLYRLGRGVAANVVRASEYYGRAADAGHAGARGALATIYYFDDGTRQKRGAAIALWRQAAAAGDAPSQYTLAILHFNGQDVPHDLMQAYAWALLAAEGGMEEGQKAERTIRARLTPNQQAQARVLKRGLLVSAPVPPVITPVAPPVAEEKIAVFEEMPAPEPAAPEPAAPAQADTKQLVEEAATGDTKALPTGNWSVQLGFYRNPVNAEQYWQKIAPRLEALMPEISGGVVTVDYGPERGIFHQLLAGSFTDKAAADGLCDELKAASIDCATVRR